MNRKISTLLAGIALMGAVSANATTDLKDGYYYHLQTPAVGATSGEALNLVLTKNYLGTKADSIIAVVAKEADAKTDSAMWKAAYAIDPVTGEYTYTITNKAVPSAQFSFAAGSNVKGITVNNANQAAYGAKEVSSLSGSMKFAWGAPAGTGVTTIVDAASVISSYVQAKDSTLFLAVKLDAAENFTTKKFPLTQVMVKGNKPTVVAGTVDQANPIVSLKAVAPEKHLMTADELNNKLGKDKGFQLFFFLKNKLTSENNALTNVIFEAEAGTNGVLLKAKTLAPKVSKADPSISKPLYAYIDTVSYSAATNLPTDGSRMTFKVDTLPTTDGLALASNGILTPAAYTFNFIVDPSNPKDSVAVFVNASYNPSAAGVAPHTYTVMSTTDKAFPLQIDALGGTSSDKTILTTAEDVTVFNTYPTLATTPTLSEDTRIAFTGGDLISAPLDPAKVYSVKIMNKDASYKAKAGKYLIANLEGDEAYASNVFTHVPATQFVYNGSKLLNREFASVETGVLYAVDADKNLYTDLTDTLEVVAMADIDIEDATIGYANISKDSLTNYAFSFDYISGILEGRSVDMKSDSSVVATVDAEKLFKLKEVDPLAPISGSAEIEEVAQLENKAYKIYSKDMKTILYVGEDGKLYMTGVNGEIAADADAAEADVFYLKETENVGEYILINDDKKFNVNSTNEALEAVALSLTNNAFAVQVEGAPDYVLDAKGHYNIENLRGDMLAADANGFGMFRKEGELKAAYETADFALYVDTAKIHPTQPSYFILSGAKTVQDTDTLEGNFLRVMTDSIAVEGYKAANGYTRLAFVPAKRVATSDSLLVNYQNATLVKGDSVGYKGKGGDVKQFQFKFQYTDTEGEYIAENNAGFLATYNNVLCLTPSTANKDLAQLIKLTTTSAPTANEGVEVSEVKVIAGNGNVQIVGAAGKKVVISNILGQTVANTVISSDNATIAAPAGVVVVAVEGEEAVKAIVK